MMMAGLDGILNKIDPGSPMDKDLYDLPPEEKAKIAQTPANLELALEAHAEAEEPRRHRNARLDHGPGHLDVRLDHRAEEPEEVAGHRERADELDNFVRVDMESSDYTQATIDLFKEAFAEYGSHVGIVIQAYLHRTEEDIGELAKLGADVRLCKGAYKEPPALAHQDMDTIRARYIDYMKQLIRDGQYPGIATHDDQIIDATKRFVAANGVDRDDFEFQMLYGVRPETQRELRRDGYNMMVYVPYGTEWLPYFSRRLRERKENVWFILKNFFRK